MRPDLVPVEAIGIEGGMVAAAGTLDEVRAAMPPGTPERRLDRGAVLPAFIDPHLHAYLVATDPHTNALLRRARDIRGLVDLVGTLAAAEPEDPGAGRWLRYHGYEPLLLAEHRSPTAAELDRVVSDRPLHVQSRTYHESAVNSAGLDALGIGRTTVDPPGGRILRDRRGRPTGVLLESASFAAEARSGREDAPDPAAWRSRLEAFGRRLLSLGITRIGDAAVPAAVASAFVEILASAGVEAHPLLVGSRIDEPAILPGATAKVLIDGGEFCHLCMTGSQLRSLMTGSFRANTGPEGGVSRAVGMRTGFPRREADGRWHTGLRFPTQAGFAELLRSAAEAGAALAVHAVGNGAVETVLRERDADRGLAARVPLRVEHAMVLEERQARALGAASLPVVAQPSFLVTTGHELTIAPMPRPLRLMPLRMLRESGVTLAFSSDYPATPLEPWASIATAIDRRDATGKAIEPDQALDLAAAIDAQTRGAANALGLVGAGTLEVGMAADLAWWDRDPVGLIPADLPGLVALETWRAGQPVHVRPAG
ncbi:MAG: amidohydrolase family protein [Chloroflexota bacterium]